MINRNGAVQCVVMSALIAMGAAVGGSIAWLRHRNDQAIVSLGANDDSIPFVESHATPTPMNTAPSYAPAAGSAALPVRSVGAVPPISSPVRMNPKRVARGTPVPRTRAAAPAAAETAWDDVDGTGEIDLGEMTVELNEGRWTLPDGTEMVSLNQDHTGDAQLNITQLGAAVVNRVNQQALLSDLSIKGVMMFAMPEGSPVITLSPPAEDESKKEPALTSDSDLSDDEMTDD
jgi:hypothetical protein